MFTDYFKTLYDNGVIIIDINGYYSKDVQERLFKEAIEKNPNKNILFRYKAYRKSTPKVLPGGITEESTYIIQFDLFATEPIVIKGVGDSFLQGILDRWKKNVDRLNAL
jgi:hypothetical protein